MVDEGILRLIGDIIVNETDPLVLVCLLYSSFSFILFMFLFIYAIDNYYYYSFSPMQKVALLLSSAIVTEWRLDAKDTEEVTRDILSTILRMILVCIL